MKKTFRKKTLRKKTFRKIRGGYTEENGRVVFNRTERINIINRLKEDPNMSLIKILNKEFPNMRHGLKINALDEIQIIKNRTLFTSI